MLSIGYDRHPDACKAMWKTLCLEYKACKDNNNKSGSRRLSMKQLEQMDDMLGENESTLPKFLYSSGFKISEQVEDLLTPEEVNLITSRKDKQGTKRIKLERIFKANTS